MITTQFNFKTGFPIQHKQQTGILKVYEKEETDLLPFEKSLAEDIKNELGGEVTLTFYNEVNDATLRGNMIKNNNNGTIAMLDVDVMDVIGVVDSRPDSYAVAMFARYLKN